MTSVKQALVAVAVTAGVMLVLAGMVAAVRMSKKGGPGMAVVGSVLLLALGGALAPQRPEQGVEEAREDKQKKGSESGDPPVDQAG
jgi:hypothetical protein